MTSLKKKIVDAKDDFMDSLNRQKKMGAFMVGGGVLILLSLFLLVPVVQANIRNSQMRSLVQENINSKKVTFLEYKTMDKVISEQKAITVLFSQPNEKAYNKVIAILKDSKKLAEFNRGLSIYPIVYNVKEVETKYSIKATEPTVIFFENGKEQNRLTLTSEIDINSILIPEFNRLPSGQAETEPPVVEPTVESTQESSQQPELSIEQTVSEEVSQ